MASNSQNEIRLAPGVPVLSEGDIVLEGCVGEGAFGSVFRASYRGRVFFVFFFCCYCCFLAFTQNSRCDPTSVGDAVAVKQLSRNATMLLRAYDGSSFGGGDGGPGGLSSVSEEADRSDEDPHDGDSPDLRGRVFVCCFFVVVGCCCCLLLFAVVGCCGLLWVVVGCCLLLFVVVCCYLLLFVVVCCVCCCGLLWVVVGCCGLWWVVVGCCCGLVWVVVVVDVFVVVAWLRPVVVD